MQNKEIGIRWILVSLLVLSQQQVFGQCTGCVTPMNLPDCYGLEHLPTPRRETNSLAQHSPELDGAECDDPLHLKRAQQRRLLSSSLRPDQTDLFSVGVDPATLVPQGIDLGFLPKFQLSEQLSLMPALSYGPDSLRTRNGHLRYGAPKQWRNHYGELVRVVSRLDGQKYPIGRNLVNPNAADGLRRAVPAEIQTYFINATGQEVSFYPDPDQFPAADGSGEPNTENPGDFPINGQLSVWYSEAGRYRLEDMQPTANTPQFVIMTPEGLEFELEAYKAERDHQRESLSIHYRVKKITDRHGNYILVEPDDPDGLEPGSVKGYKAGTSGANFHQRIRYEYEVVGGVKRLSRFYVPKYTGSESLDATSVGETAYEFYYPDHESLYRESELPSVSVNGSTATLRAIYQSGQNVENEVYVREGIIEMDFSVIPQLIHVALDTYDDDEDAASSFMFRVYRTNPAKEFVFRIVSLHPEQINFQQGAFIPPILYRYQRFPEVGREDKPDLAFVTQIGGTATFTPSDEGEYGVEVFPIVKNGDRILVPDSPSNQIATVQLDYEATDIDPDSITVDPPISGGPATGYHLREDNFFRIAEIRFPEEGGAATGRKRLVIGYDDTSINHQEIRSVKTYYGDRLLNQTTYDYERVRVFTGSDDVFSFFTQTGSPYQIPGTNASWTLCPINLSHSFGQFLSYGLTFAREEELDILRKKTVRFLRDPDETDILAAPPLVTRFGGAYHYVLAGALNASEEPNHNSNYCEMVQWGLDGKLFDFTWEIAPDGSAQVFDLSAEGLGLIGAHANYNQRRRIFKTYRFDTNFAQNMMAAYPGHFHGVTPFYDFLPYYASQTTTLDDDEDPLHPTPGLADLFAWKNGGGSKAYEAEVSVFETVPLFKYRQSTGATNPNDFFRREALQLLYGELQTVGETYAGKRVSAIRLLNNAAGLLTEAQELFKGILSSGEIYILTGNRDIPWELGGRLDLGNAYSAYFDIQKLLQLQPHFTYSLRNYGGFDWTGDPGRIDFDADRHFKQGVRHSNGGYLGTGHATASQSYNHQNLAATGSLTLNNPGFTPDPNDIFVHKMLVYTVLDYQGSQVTFTPDLRMDLDTSDDLEFYRVFNPTWNNGEATVANGYIGHDAFGNNGYQEQYFGKNQGLTWPEDPGAELVPRYQNESPDAVAWNDSTDPDNQDLEDWTYFGRITKSFTGHALPFHDYSDAQNPDQSSGPFTGHVTSFTYGGPFDWKPDSETRHFRPVVDADFPLTSLPAQHDEDRISEYTYHTATGNQVLANGRLVTQKTYLDGDPNSFTFEDFDYDNNGRVSVRDSASFKNAAADYGMRSEIQRDGNTGLPMRETVRVASATLSGGSLVFTNLKVQGRTYRDYDELGRETRMFATDAVDALFGPVTHTELVSPLETRVLNTDGTEISSNRLTRNITYRDGLERELLSVNQFGNQSNPNNQTFHATGMTYDAFGRPQRSYFSKELDAVDDKNPVDLFGTGAGYSLNIYNSRSAVSGNVVYDGSLVESSSWTVTTQNPADGNDVIFSFYQDKDPSASMRVNIKQQQPDRFGNLAIVSDIEATSGPGVFTAFSAAETFLDGQPATTAPPLLDASPASRAEYGFDRFGNVIDAETGTASTQTRTFRFDQNNRLRFEDHPEMDVDVVYGSHDLFDNPQTIDYGNGRTAEWVYNAAGQPETVDYKQGGNTEVSSEWEYTFWNQNFPGLVSEVLTQDDTGKGVAYKFDYHPNRGLLTQKQMVHNLPGFSVGYDADLQDPEWSGSLKLSYTYDSLGRTETMTYPAAVEGNAVNRTRLEFHYSEETGLLDHVKDLSLGVANVLGGFEYGPDDRLKAFDFQMFGGAGHGVEKRWDAFNRLEHLDFHVHSAPVANFTSQYGYDQGARIISIASNWLTQLPSGKNNEYGYDTLGQLVDAEVPVRILTGGNPTAQVYDFAFSYDGSGLGNLVAYEKEGTYLYQNAVSLTNNRIQLGNFNYNAYGEMEGLFNYANAETYDLEYRADGRLVSVTDGTEEENYTYDSYGLRVHKDAGTSGEDTLYFYGDDNQVLTEWVNDNGNDRWDRSYLHLGGNSVLTFEYDSEETTESGGSGEAGINLLPKTYVPPPKVLGTDTVNTGTTLAWGRTDDYGKYDFQVGKLENGKVTILKTLPGVSGQTIRLNLEEGSYLRRVRVAGANWGDWQPFDVQVSVSLAAPTGLTAAAGTNQDIDLAWTIHGGPDYVYVERSTDLSNWTSVVTLGSSAETYTDTNLTAGFHYYYRVRESKGGETWSDYSNIAAASIPVLPTVNFGFDSDAEGWTNANHLSTFGFSGGQLLTQSTGNDPFLVGPALSFSGNEVTVIQIRMSSTGGTGQLFWKTAAAPSFSSDRKKTFILVNDGELNTYNLDLSTDPQWAGQQIVGLRLDPTNATGIDLGIDYIVSVATPEAPTGLTATTLDHERIELSWTDQANDETGYKIERAAAGTGQWLEIAAVGPNNTGYESTRLRGNTSYDFRVRAFNGYGHSFYSATATEATELTPVIHYAFDEDAQGFSANNQLESFSIANGFLGTRSTGVDPYSIGPAISIYGDELAVLRIRMKASAGTTGKLYWRADGDPWFSEAKSKSFNLTSDGNFYDYVLNLAAHSEWLGKKINRLRFDPSNQSGAYIEIDELIGYSSSIVAFHFENHEEGWVENPLISSGFVSGGVLGGTSMGNDPSWENHAVSFQANSVPILYLRFKVTAGTSAQLFWQSPGDTAFTQTKSKTIGYLIADGEFHTYTLNLASHSEWQGQITGLRFDPTNAAGSIEVDYILDFQPPQ